MSKTVIHKDGKTLFGEEDLLEVSKNRSFSQMIFETLSGKTPSDPENKIFELILNLSIDHGPDTPSAIATIEVAKAGKTISQSVAAGVMKIDDSHGGAIEPCMEILKGSKSAEELAKEYLSQNKKIPGYGHRIYKEEDPRAQGILEELQKAGIGAEYAKNCTRA